MSVLKNGLGWIRKQFILEETPENVLPEEKPEIISLIDLPKWLDAKEQDYLVQSGLTDETNNYANGIKELKWKVEGRLEEWENNFPPIKKLKREEIMRLFVKVRQLLAMITFSEQAGIKEVQKVNFQIDPKLDFLIRKMENTTYAREFSVVIGEEEKEIVESVIIGPILSEMLKIRKLNDDFEQKIVQSDLGKISSVRESILDLKGFKLIQEELELEIGSRDNHLRIVEERILEKELEINTLNEKLFPNVSEEDRTKKIQQDELLVQLGNIEEAVNQFFNKIKPALKQYYLMMPGNKLMVEYFDDPFGSFSKDTNLEILKILQELDNILRNDNLRLAPEEVEEILSLLSGAEESLGSLQKSYTEIKSELGETEIKVSDKLSSLKIGDAQYRLNHFKSQAEKLRQETEESEKKVQEQLEHQRKEMELLVYNIKLVTGKKVKIEVR